MFTGKIKQLFIEDVPSIKNVYFSHDKMLGLKKNEELNFAFFDWFEKGLTSGKIICYGSLNDNDELMSYSYFYISDFYPYCFIGGVHIDKKFIGKMYNYNYTGRAEIMDELTRHAMSMGITEIYMAHTVKSFITRAKLFNKAFKNSTRPLFNNIWYVIPEEILSKNEKSRFNGFNSFISLLKDRTEDIVIWKLVLKEDYRQIMNDKRINTAISLFKKILS